MIEQYFSDGLVLAKDAEQTWQAPFFTPKLCNSEG